MFATTKINYLYKETKQKFFGLDVDQTMESFNLRKKSGSRLVLSSLTPALALFLCGPSWARRNIYPNSDPMIISDVKP